MNITEHFVSNQNIPEYIKTEHGMFDTFIKAYYEWLELKNDSENATYYDVYKAVGNPGWLGSNQEKLVDIDETIDEFIEYFAKEVCPIAIDNIQTNPRFFLKKIRDLYLAKGTPNSFILFFKLYYNDDIDVFETGKTILRVSDGKYFAFPTAHFYVTDFRNNLERMEFTLSELLDDSENLVTTILSGEVVGVTKDNDPIVKIKFGDGEKLEQGEYFIRNSDGVYKIKVSAMVSIKEMTLSKTAALYDDNDQIYIDSLGLGRRFFGTVESVTSGTVEGIKVRDRGVYYTPNDYFQFQDKDVIDGNFVITDTGTYGEIEKINNIPLRSGSNNEGFTAGNLEDVYIGISKGGKFKSLPYIKYRNVGDFSLSDVGNPYLKPSVYGVGLQVTPVSTSIGTVKAITMNQETFFKDSDDVFINPPATVVVENNNLKRGDKVSFQSFGNLANYEPFTDDSEELIFEYTFVHYYETGLPDGYTYLDSEKTYQTKVNFIYDFDSETFEWKHESVNLKMEFDPNGLHVIQPLKALLEQSRMSYTIEETYAPTDVLDGGPYDAISDSEYSGGDDSEWNNNYVKGSIDGGPEFTFAGSKISKIKIKFDGKSVRRLEDHHFDKLNDLVGMDSDVLFFKWYKTVGEPRLPDADSDVGVWYDLGYYGEVVDISGNGQVVKIVGYQGSDLPTQEYLDNISKEKYNVLKLSPMKNGVSVKDYNLPLTNIVHQIQRIEIDYKTEVVSGLFSKFYSQDGFISSDFGGTIQDNYYYSDYSYRIKTQLPMQTWKEKVKTMLHPAGFIMTSNFVQNFETDMTFDDVDINASDNFKTPLTFDMQQEYVDLNTVAKGITADHVFYKSNAFEAISLVSGTASSLLASNENTIRNLLFKQQSGNAFWDFEPIGYSRKHIDSEIAEHNKHIFDQYLNLDSDMFMNRYSTQDSDGTGKVKNEYRYYKLRSRSKQDFYKGGSRVKNLYLKNMMTVKTFFEEQPMFQYDAYDSELPDDFMTTFNDSDMYNFTSIEYRRLLGDNDNRYYPVYTIPRTSEIAMMKERDFLTAMREDGSLKFDDSDKVYVDFEAYERKWNSINNRRTRNHEGWSIKGFNQLVGYEDILQRNKKRNKGWQLEDHRDFTSKHAPLNTDVYDRESLGWERHYYEYGVINNRSIDLDYENETYKDPAVSMRNRRRGR